MESGAAVVEDGGVVYDVDVDEEAKSNALSVLRAACGFFDAGGWQRGSGDSDAVADAMATGGLVDINSSECRDTAGYSPLDAAAKDNHVELLEELINRAGADPVNAKSLFGETPLHYAARYGAVDTTRALLKVLPLEAINAQDSMGRTAFYWACCDGRDDTARMLAATQGVELARADSNGMTPLAVATYGHRYDIIRWLKPLHESGDKADLIGGPATMAKGQTALEAEDAARADAQRKLLAVFALAAAVGSAYLFWPN